jgi:hypothetical protein
VLVLQHALVAASGTKTDAPARHAAAIGATIQVTIHHTGFMRYCM